jgi:hypothetical protein
MKLPTHFATVQYHLHSVVVTFPIMYLSSVSWKSILIVMTILIYPLSSNFPSHTQGNWRHVTSLAFSSTMRKPWKIFMVHYWVSYSSDSQYNRQRVSPFSLYSAATRVNSLIFIPAHPKHCARSRRILCRVHNLDNAWCNLSPNRYGWQLIGEHTYTHTHTYTYTKWWNGSRWRMKDDTERKEGGRNWYRNLRVFLLSQYRLLS